MAEPKTRPTTESVAKFIDGIEDEIRRKDCYQIVEMMRNATKAEPVMWGSSIIGFGTHNYKPEAGAKAEWPLIAFASRKADLTLYLMSGISRHPELLKKLGKHKVGKGCLYIKKLDDVDLPTLRQLIKQSATAAASIRSTKH